MSWKSLSVGKAKSASNKRSTTCVVTTTFTNFDARYQALKADGATLIGNLYSCNEEAVRKSLLEQLQSLCEDIRIVVNKFEGQPLSLEWKQLLLDAYKCMLHGGLKSSDHIERRHDLFLLGLQSLTLMEDLHRKDVGLISCVLEIAVLCEDRWIYDNLLAQYASCFTGIYQALLHKTREAARQLPYSRSIPHVVDNPPDVESSVVEVFEAPDITNSAVALLVLQRLVDATDTTSGTTDDAHDQLAKLRQLITSTLSDHTNIITLDSHNPNKAAERQQSSIEIEAEVLSEQDEQDRMQTRFRGPPIVFDTNDISEVNSLQNNVDEVLAAIFERWLHEEDEPMLSHYDNLDFIHAQVSSDANAITPCNTVLVDEPEVRDMDLEVDNDENQLIDLEFITAQMQTVIKTLNTMQSQENDLMIVYRFNKQLLGVLTLFSQLVSSLTSKQMKNLQFDFHSVNLTTIRLYASIINVQQSYHFSYDLSLTVTVFTLENALNILETDRVDSQTYKFASYILAIALQHISSCTNHDLDVVWRVRILWVGSRLSLSQHSQSYNFKENRLSDLLQSLQTLGNMIGAVSHDVCLPHLCEEYAVINALHVAKLINKSQALTLTSHSNSTGVQMMNEILDSFDSVKLEHYLLSNADKKSLSVIEVLHTLTTTTTTNRQQLLATWQGIRKVLAVFTAMAKKMKSMDDKQHASFLQTLSEVVTIIQDTHQLQQSSNRSGNELIGQEIREICHNNLTIILQIYVTCEYSLQTITFTQHLLSLIIALDYHCQENVTVIVKSCLVHLFAAMQAQKSSFQPTNCMFVLYQLLSTIPTVITSEHIFSLLTKKALIRCLCLFHLPYLDCTHVLFKYYMSTFVILVQSIAHVLSDYDTLEFIFYLYNNLGDHGMYAHDHLTMICRCTCDILVNKLRLLEKEVIDIQIVADKVYDAYLALANCYQVLYNLPLTSYTTASSSSAAAAAAVEGEEVSLSTASSMYQLVQKCANLRDFTKQDIRDSLVWLLDLTVVKHVLLTQEGGKWKRWVLELYNHDSNIHIPVYSDDDQEKDVKLLSNIYYDLLELGLVVTGPESLCKQAEFLSLIEAYPFLRCLDRHPAMDIKLKQAVEYAAQDLYFHPWRLESWSMLLVKFQDAALSLTDMLHETVDYYYTQAYFDRMLSQFEIEHDKEERMDVEESIWKMDPECWVNHIIPWVESFYRYLTTNDNQMEQFTQWKVESFAEETFQQRLIPNKMARFYCFKDFAFFVKGLLFTYRLKRYFDMAVHKTYAVIVNTDFQRVFDQQQDGAVDTSVLQHSLVEIHEAYGLSLSFLAKDYPRRSVGRKQYLQQALTIFRRNEVQEESIFAAVTSAKWLWQLHRHDKAYDAINIALNIRQKLVDNEQIVGKTYRIHAWYQCHSLSSKFALWILTQPVTASATNPLTSQLLMRLLEAFGVDFDETTEQRNMAWMVLVESIRHLIDCRKRDPYHFRTHYRLSDIIFKICHAQINVPEDIKNQLKALLNVPDISYQSALTELHTKLFDKKRQQIVAMWAVDTPNHAWDQMTARVSEFDSLRRKFIDRYLLLAKLCGEVEMIYNLTQQTFGKLSTATLHYITHQSIMAMLAAIPIKLQTIRQDNTLKQYQTKLTCLEQVYTIYVALNKRKHVSSLIPAIESCLRELLIAFINDSTVLIESYTASQPIMVPEIAAVDLIKPTPEVAASGLKAVHILLPLQTAPVATTATETTMDVAEPVSPPSKTMSFITLTFNHAWGSKEVLSQVSSILSLHRKLSQPEGTAGIKRGRGGGAAKDQRETSNDQPSSKSPRFSQAEPAASAAAFSFPEQASQQQHFMEKELFEEQVML